MTRILFSTLVVSGMFLTASVTLAHHAASAKYDANKPITLKGTVTKVEWQNPHIYFYIDVTEENGETHNWAVEGSTPNQLYRRGWRRDSLKEGDNVTVEAIRARDPDLRHVNGRSVMLPDGRTVFSGGNDGLPEPARN